MKHSTILRKRNQFVLFLFTAGTIIHAIISIIGLLNYVVPFPLITSIYCGLLLILSALHLNEYVMRTLLIIGLNGSNLIMILQSDYIYHLIFLFLLLFLLPIYQSIWINITMIIITIIQIILLIEYHYLSFRGSINDADITLFILILFFLGAIGIIQGFYINYSWKKIETHSDSLEKAFLSKEGYLNLFFENAKDSIAVFDLENKIIAINPAFEKLYGWKPEECIGKAIPLVPPEYVNAAVARSNHLMNGGSFDLLESKDMKKDGTYFDAQITLSPIFDYDGEIIATSIITRDISYKKEAEKLIIQSEKLKAIGEIAAGVAHEVRNPLTVISGFVQMMNNDKNSPYAFYTNLIESEIDRINLIIGEFLVLSKPHAMQPKEFKIDKVITDILTLYRPELQLRNISLTENWHANDLTVKGDVNQIKQVFINIIKNAVEAIEKEGDIIITIDKTSNHFFTICVTDNGSGMKKEVVENIFKPFYTTKETGTGLGMMITEKIILEHEGQITINSEYGKGSSITIKLPYIKA
ncbi:PAS domain S-box protein [Viridibacillus sp. YIM B01967]|uniref:histidine kinase n=1 Tax=Viridibacillus soli TaxID=2798301 RepID=A0ABS1H7G3_9BACL|nr:ATP-binding protein [Viridibacillus soli]MBK3495346.1 PAS domain S-box protein [Viridibacillus soli]